MSVAEAFGLIAAGIAVGALSAFFGIGGGVVMVPFLVIAIDLSQKTAEGTSLVVITVAGLAGTYAHMRSGYVAMGSAARLGLGGIGGAVIGALTALELSNPTLRAVFAAYLAATGIVLIVTAILSSRRPGRGNP